MSLTAPNSLAIDSPMDLVIGESLWDFRLAKVLWSSLRSIYKKHSKSMYI